jgi:hypothetical protein
VTSQDFPELTLSAVELLAEHGLLVIDEDCQTTREAEERIFALLGRYVSLSRSRLGPEAD